MSKASSREILRSLKDLNGYLSQFNQSQRSAEFEQLIAQALSSALYLPFFISSNDDSSIPHRVVWKGNTNPLRCAPPGGPDAIAHCCDFHLAIEATMKTGAHQWSQEFAPSIRHCEEFCGQNGIPPRDAYILLIVTKLHVDTYRSMKNYSGQQYRLVPLEVEHITRIIQTAILAFTLRHLDLRRFFNSVCDCVSSSSSLADFGRSTNVAVVEWQKDVLRQEKGIFIGVKSYEAMRKIRRQHIGSTEILQRLQKHPTVRQYFKLIGDRVGTDTIADALVSHSFAVKVGATYEAEQIFQPVPIVDFTQRGSRLLSAVGKIK